MGDRANVKTVYFETDSGTLLSAKIPFHIVATDGLKYPD